jgi:DNA helicase-2/ATP-dependent DNA helicase PcrA
MTAPALAPELLAALDSDQAAAVAAFGPRTLVVAGAGSGKTRVLTYGLAHLLDAHGMQPEELMLLTFTRRAAEEMRERAAEVCGRDLSEMRAGTFHAVGARMLSPRRS